MLYNRIIQPGSEVIKQHYLQRWAKSSYVDAFEIKIKSKNKGGLKSKSFWKL